MYPEANTLLKQPYPVRSAAGLVDLAKTIRVDLYLLAGAHGDEVVTLLKYYA
jgi:hypothetical protein